LSLAPASSRGAFLNARFAVNGIQCAARSFGTLTLAGRGLLSSMAASSSSGVGEFHLKLSASPAYGNADTAHICTAVGEFEGDGEPRARRRSRTLRLANPHCGVSRWCTIEPTPKWPDGRQATWSSKPACF